MSGAEDPRNFALGDLELAAQTLPRNGELRIETQLVRRGPAASRTVRLHLEKPDLRRPIRMDGKTLLPEEAWMRSQTVEVAENASAAVRFSVSGLTTGVHQGYVEIVGEDGLQVDDRRYFTIEVKDAWPVLIVSPADSSGKLIDGMTDKFVVQALAPTPLSDSASFDCNRVRQADLGNENLADYAAICLLDPQPLPPPLWEKLSQYVESGGGLVICLGSNAAQNNRPNKSFNDETAQALLPGTISELWRSSSNDVFLRPRNMNHAIMAELRPIASTVPWNEFPRSQALGPAFATRCGRDRHLHERHAGGHRKTCWRGPCVYGHDAAVRSSATYRAQSLERFAVGSRLAVFRGGQ